MPAVIPFLQPWISGDELTHIAQAIAGQGGPEARRFTQACERWLETRIGSRKAYLTPSCTAALEMAAILAGIGPGDEVIMASFTFPSMANAFALRGGIPVFVDIRPDTLNIDERLVEAAITPRTRAIVAMHYGGVACEMDAIMALADRHGLVVIEDAAHAIGATYQGRPLGSIGHLAAFSFHRTKNVQCGEGGALLINDARFLDRAGNVRENGTDRTRFERGEVPFYSWVDIGSSFIMSEFSAAFLWAQLQCLDAITAQRRALWLQYRAHWAPGSSTALPAHNAHIFYVICGSRNERQSLAGALQRNGIQTSPHYQPLHASLAGRRLASAPAPLPHTLRVTEGLLRLPLWPGMSAQQAALVCEAAALHRPQEHARGSAHAP